MTKLEKRKLALRATITSICNNDKIYDSIFVENIHKPFEERNEIKMSDAVDELIEILEDLDVVDKMIAILEELGKDDEK